MAQTKLTSPPLPHHALWRHNRRSLGAAESDVWCHILLQEFLRLTSETVELRKSLLPFLGCAAQPLSRSASALVARLA